MKMMVRETKRDIRPVLLKFGAALALSLGGILYTFFRNQKITPGKSRNSQLSLDNERAEQINDDQASQTSCNSGLTASERYDLPLARVTSDDSISDLSQSNPYNEDRDNLLLPEFKELIREYNADSNQAPDEESHAESKSVQHDERDQEILTLRTKVKALEEREKYLESQLLEYYGLKEQEKAVMELQNRLKLNNMESKLYSLKIESLLADKQRLGEQVADYGEVVAELEAARAKIKLLKKKLRSEAKQNREQILALQERVMKLQDEEKKAIVSDHGEVNIQQVKELKEELDELRKLNDDLKMENSELAKKLEQVLRLANPVLDDDEARKLKQETLHLRQQNEDLSKQIKQIQTDRCTDIDSDQLSSSASYLTDSGEPDYSSVNTSNKTSTSSKAKVFSKLMNLLRGKSSKSSAPTKGGAVDDNVFRYSSSSFQAETGVTGLGRRSSECSLRHYSPEIQGISYFRRSASTEAESSRRNSDDHSFGIYRSITSTEDQSSLEHEKSELVKYAESLKKSRAKLASFRRRSSSFGSL